MSCCYQIRAANTAAHQKNDHTEAEAHSRQGEVRTEVRVTVNPEGNMQRCTLNSSSAVNETLQTSGGVKRVADKNNKKGFIHLLLNMQRLGECRGTSGANDREDAQMFCYLDTGEVSETHLHLLDTVGRPHHALQVKQHF